MCVCVVWFVFFYYKKERNGLPLIRVSILAVQPQLSAVELSDQNSPCVHPLSVDAVEPARSILVYPFGGYIKRKTKVGSGGE